jgi:hypothetical protein
MNAPLAHPVSGDELPSENACQLCGRPIEEHSRVDTFDGSIFLCEEVRLSGDLVRQWELADLRDAWRHTGEPPPPASVRNSDISAAPAKAPQCRTPQSVIDAFFYVLKTKDAAGIAEWLAAHPQDERYLQKIWEQKCSTAAAR